MKRMTRRVVAAIVAGALGSSALTVPLVASATPVTTFAALAAAAPGSPAHSVDRAFTSWAAANLHEVSLTSRTNWADLEPLRRMIGDARVVSLGEGLHGSAEPLEFRNRLFQFLVERMDFTAIALESGLTESYALDAYVLGGPGDPRQLAARYITSGLGGEAGNDRIYGSEGNDVLGGDEGDDLLVGNAGNDRLFGRIGRDVVIGGTGADEVSGQEDQDALIGRALINEVSATVGDANDVALTALLAQWVATQPLNLFTPFLAANDGVRDVLTGGTGIDDFYADVNDRLADYRLAGAGQDRRIVIV